MTPQYVLLALDIIVVAFVLWFALWLVIFGVWWLRRRSQTPPAPAERECQRCGRYWSAIPGMELSKTMLRLQRRARRRRRRLKKSKWAWTRRKAWSRCPSCLSSRVVDLDEKEHARQRVREQREARTKDSPGPVQRGA